MTRDTLSPAVLQQAGPIRARFAGETAPDPWCLVRIPEQTLFLVDGEQTLRGWPVSTSRHGTGCKPDSFRTPTGAHRVAERIGDGAPVHTVFRHRVATDSCQPPSAPGGDPDEDIITTRILWLDGLEPGHNRGEGCDSRLRHIYIHGTNQEQWIGEPASVGCIRMRAADVMELFDAVRENTLVLILS